MDTRYIGPFPSENGQTGREMRTELRVEPSEGYPGQLDVGVYRWVDGECIRTLHLDRTNAALLRDALDEYIQGV